MKKSLTILLAAIVATACTKNFTEENISANPGDMPDGVTGCVGSFYFDEDCTRTNIQYTPEGMSFAWKDSDSRKVAVFGASKNQQLSISLDGHYDDKMSSKADFNVSDDFTLNPGHKYVAYYPVMNESILLEASKVSFDYSGQVQMSNSIASTNHLGDYDFICSVPVEPVGTNKVLFRFQHQCCPVGITITNVPAGIVGSVRLAVADDSTPFTISGTYDLFSPEYTDEQIKEATDPNGNLDGSKLAARAINDGALKSSSVTVSYNETLTLKNNSTIYAWIMIAPANLLGKTMKVQLLSPEGNVVNEYTAQGKNFKHSKAYLIKIENEENPAMPSVDLGLPSGTLWASMNVGANFPTEIGDYYKYGETTPYTKFVNVSGSSEDPLPDDKDAAYVNIGTDWQLPTVADWNELFINCNWTKSSDGTYYVIEGPNRNSIYLPIAGYMKANLESEASAYYLSKSPKVAIINTSGKNCTNSAGNSYYTVRAVKKAKNDPAVVDLGLESGTLWSTINLGAIRFESNSSITAYGDRWDLGLTYSWGEITPKNDDANPKNYSMYSSNSLTSWSNSNTSISVTKYATSKTRWAYSDDPDGLTQLLPENDIATQTLGEEWHIPTETQWKELISSCTWAAEGSYQAVGTSKKNGEKIILPVVNYVYNGNVGSGMYYWSSTLSTGTTTSNDQRYAMAVYSSLNNFITYAKSGSAMTYEPRCYAYVIRPVKDAPKAQQ